MTLETSTNPVVLSSHPFASGAGHEPRWAEWNFLSGGPVIRLLGTISAVSGLVMGLAIRALASSPWLGWMELSALAISLAIFGVGVFLALDRGTPWVARLSRVPRSLL